MKKLIHTLLVTLFLGISFMPMHAASAATLTLGNTFGGAVQTGSGSTVSGEASGFVLFGISLWTLQVDSDTEVQFNLGNAAGADFSIAASGLFDNGGFAPPPVFGFSGSTGSTLLSAGLYYLQIFPGFANIGQSYNLTISEIMSPVNQVPVPAAVWLFGSAIFGLLGGLRRKNKLVTA